MLCPRCSREIPDDANLCCYCGRVFSKSTGKRTRPNGSGSARKRGNTWQASVVIGWIWDENKQKFKPDRPTKDGFSTKKEALEYCPTLRKEALAKRSGIASAPSEAKTVSFYWAIAKAQLEKKGVTKLKAYGYAYDKLEAIHAREVSTLSVKQLQDIIDEKTDSFYPAKDMKTVLSKVFALALADEVTSVDKSKSIVLPPLEEEQGEPFTMDEIKLQWEAFDRGYTFVGYVLLMDYTGMMPGELLSCTKSMIDFDKCQIVGAGKKTKTRKQAPIVFPDFIGPVLHALCEFSPSQNLLCMNKDNFYKKFKETIVEIGCRKLPPYSCRHTTGTALAVGGNVAPAIIQKIMRHAKYQSTQRYIHPSYSDASEGVNTLEKPV